MDLWSSRSCDRVIYVVSNATPGLGWEHFKITCEAEEDVCKLGLGEEWSAICLHACQPTLGFTLNSRHPHLCPLGQVASVSYSPPRPTSSSSPGQ
jgi:hypothetical protein